MAGSPTIWKNTPTKAIRIPVAFESEILNYAQSLDQGMPIDQKLVNLKQKILKDLGVKPTSATYKKIDQALDRFIELSEGDV